ncbi:hypothetical protein [Plebeiibacterium sediminum]|uniref:Uncharacterized protein n=1 Tax=Plebeiibacterium sediminum TaxID=2992112 RepID=A0AAE3MAG9_9BACT|nr:hypothetical protein [Plebeiobacterium sediminum]MCW3789430.1 hypothetical protein [Plebeiobacterium sediminum]
MNFEEEFEQWKDQIENLAKENVKLPNNPIDEFTAYAENLAIEALKDKDKLEAAGLNPTYIDDLKSLSGALRYCQAMWTAEFKAMGEARQQWKIESPEAFQLKKEMLHHLSFAYRNMDDVIQKVKRIRKGSGNADMIQDLLELSVLAEKYPEPLTKIGFDTTLVSKSRTVSNEMRELLAQANGGDTASVIKLNRDKAFTLLQIRITEICEVGRYIFWEDPDRLSAYKSLK